MYQATTPKFTFTVPFETSSIVDLRLTFDQHGKTILNLGYEDVVFQDTTKIVVTFTQQQASLFRPDQVSDIQLRVKFEDGNVAASNYVKVKVFKALNLEVM